MYSLSLCASACTDCTFESGILRAEQISDGFDIHSQIYESMT
jgi:hypothetical protein